MEKLNGVGTYYPMGSGGFDYVVLSEMKGETCTVFSDTRCSYYNSAIWRISAANADKGYSEKRLDIFRPDGTDAEVWVDPASGLFVGYSDTADFDLRPERGEKLSEKQLEAAAVQFLDKLLPEAKKSGYQPVRTVLANDSYETAAVEFIGRVGGYELKQTILVNMFTDGKVWGVNAFYFSDYQEADFEVFDLAAAEQKLYAELEEAKLKEFSVQRTFLDIDETGTCYLGVHFTYTDPSGAGGEGELYYRLEK